MATIVERKRKNGTRCFQAQIAVWKDGKSVFRETRTFDRKQAAAAWGELRERELSKAGELDRALGVDPSFAQAIDRYTAEAAKLGRTKKQVLATLKAKPFARMRCSEIGSPHIVTLARELRETMLPQTVAGYLSHISAIFMIARPAWGFPLDQQAIKDAFIVCKRLGITGKSRERDRRPTLAELDRILTYFAKQETTYRKMIPMTKIVVFALFSTRRQDEITRIKWADLDPHGARIMVRDMKDPGQKMGNNVRCDLPPEALMVIATMPRKEERIFPYKAPSISMSFARACEHLKIEDLHFHDLRHEGVSRLLEMGYTIPRAAGVSGHRAWVSLKRYAHLRQTGDKFANWKWLDRIVG